MLVKSNILKANIQSALEEASCSKFGMTFQEFRDTYARQLTNKGYRAWTFADYLYEAIYNIKNYDYELIGEFTDTFMEIVRQDILG